ncbi:RNA-directed DNA polymerase, eukaryota, Reverse transcriptase zinc-binding domain protein [Artemisia annua]|uniref:RNA-directed DNA polymerase, eukaryota, Reverse transcriptase zinc-binding domain protein n=1 Tax=Artemisia annua TaxID=35608 RepID=A0A2U1M6A5_ARTAN|nr:RNA-directed DNA polymerase, eukaryota, Reverse transcriptase zinc-binding domain protein [Artemisia annua]
MVQYVDINPPPKSYVGATTGNNAANTKTGKKKNRNKGKAKANTAGNTFNGFPVGKNMYYRPKATTTPSQTAQGEASTSSGPPSKKVDASASSCNQTSNQNITPSNCNDKTFQSNPKASSPNITVTVSTSNPFDLLAFDEGVQEEGFLDTVTSGWNQNVNGCSIYRVVKRLKGLKSFFRKLLHNQGNLHERVDSLRKELDEVRGLSGMDSVPPVLADVITFLFPISKGRSVASIISRLLLAATTYYIWVERNARLFKRKKSTVAEVVQVIVSNVRLKLVTFKFKKLTVRSRSMLDSWKIPSACLIHEGSTS